MPASNSVGGASGFRFGQSALRATLATDRGPHETLTGLRFPRPDIVRALHLGSVFALASLVEGGKVQYNIEVEYLAVLLVLMFVGLLLAGVDWIAEMTLVTRPWFTGAIGWAIGAATMGGLFNLSQPIWWWFVVKGLLVGIPALVCSWLAKRKHNASP